MRIDYVVAHPERALSPWQQKVLREADPEVQCNPASAAVLRRLLLIDSDGCLTARGEAVLRTLENLS